MQEDKTDKVPEDFDLLAEFNAGGEDAFTRIVEKHSGALINFLYRYTRNQSASEDIAQEAFLRLYKAAAGLKPGAKLATILYKIACNLAIDQARKAKGRALAVPTVALEPGEEGGGLLQPAATGDSPDEIYQNARRSETIAASLAELPAPQRIAIILKAYEGRSYAEIAGIMGLSVSAVDSLIFRARQGLAKKLNAQ